MPKILHLGHSPAALGYPSTLKSTRAGSFDPDLDDFSYGRTEFGGASITRPWAAPKLPEKSVDLWVSFRLTHMLDGVVNSPSGSPDSDYRFLTLSDSDHGVLAWVNIDSFPGDRWEVKAGGGSGGTTGDGWALDTFNSGWFDVHLSMSGGTLEVVLYVDGSEVARDSIAQPAGAVGVDTVAGAFPASYSSTTNSAYEAGIYLAHLAITDGIDTRNRRFARFKPLAAGAASQWDGAATDVNDGSPLTQVGTDTNAQRSSFTLEQVGTALPAGATVGPLHVVALASGDAANGLTPYIRSGGTDYDGDNVGYTDAIFPVVQTWANDPADSAAWTVTKVEAAEVGLLSGAAPV